MMIKLVIIATDGFLLLGFIGGTSSVFLLSHILV